MAVQVEEAQQRPQGGHQVVGRPDAAPGALADQERVDLLETEALHTTARRGRIGGALEEEQPCQPLIADDGARRQAPLGGQVVAELREQPTDRILRLRLLRIRHDAEPSQVAEQRDQALRCQPGDMPGGPAVGQELGHPRRAELLGRQPMSGQPATDVGKQVHVH